MMEMVNPAKSAEDFVPGWKFQGVGYRNRGCYGYLWGKRDANIGWIKMD